MTFVYIEASAATILFLAESREGPFRAVVVPPRVIVNIDEPKPDHDAEAQS